MTNDAAAILQYLDGPSLQQISRRLGLRVQGSAKARLIDAIAPVIFDEAVLTAAVDGLSALERLVLDRVVLAGGNTPTEGVRKQLQREGHVDPDSARESAYFGGYRRRENGTLNNRKSTKFEDVILRLGVLGLIFTAEPYDSYRTTISLNSPGQRLYIPAPALKILPPITLPAETIAEPRDIQPAHAARLLRDMYLLASFAEREQLALTVKGLLQKRSLVKLNAALQHQEDIASVRSEDELFWIPFIRSLASELDLLVEMSGTLLQGSQATDFLALPDGERRRRLYDAYARTRHWSELYRIPDIRISGRGGSLHTAHPTVIRARQRVLAELAELPSEQWIALAHLQDRLRRRAYEFLLQRKSAPNAYYYGYSPNPYRDPSQLNVTIDVNDEATGWDQVEAQLIEVIVAEALHTLGVVDLGRTTDDALAFRITADGALLLRGTTPSSVERAAEVVVQPNFQIFAFEPTSEDVLHMLDRIAERVNTGVALEFELTRGSIHRAQQSGLETSAVLEFLERVSKVGLPQNVQRTLAEWGEQIERITVRPHASLLQVADEATLDALLADAELAALLDRRVSPTAALVPSAHLTTIAAALVARDLLPAYTEGRATEPRSSVTVEPDGLVHYRERLPSIYVRQALRPFVEEDADGTRITSSSLRSAAKGGLEADSIIETLRHLSGGQLSRDVDALVRRWAKDWGRGALAEVTLLQVEQPETLNDLLADPETRPLLQPLPDAPTYAVVVSDRVAELRALLDVRGLTLSATFVR